MFLIWHVSRIDILFTWFEIPPIRTLVKGKYYTEPSPESAVSSENVPEVR